MELKSDLTQPVFEKVELNLKLTLETLDQGVKYVHS